MEEKISQYEIIYKYYKSGNSLNVWNCRDILKNPNLRSRNSEIEAKYKIKLGRIWEKTKDGKRHLTYFLEEFRYKFDKDFKKEPKQLEIFSTNQQNN